MKKHAPKSKISITKQPTTTQLDNAFNVIALASLQHHKEPIDLGSIDRESLRIERCIEYYYMSEDHDMAFGEFASNFLKTNFKELVARTKFTLDYLEDIQDFVGESYDNIEYRLAL